MTKREYCERYPAIAYYSGFGGLEAHGIEYDIIDTLYCVSGAWTGKPSYHRLIIQYNTNGEAFIMLHGYRAYLHDFIRMGV